MAERKSTRRKAKSDTSAKPGRPPEGAVEALSCSDELNDAELKLERAWALVETYCVLTGHSERALLLEELGADALNLAMHTVREILEDCKAHVSAAFQANHRATQQPVGVNHGQA